MDTGNEYTQYHWIINVKTVKTLNFVIYDLFTIIKNTSFEGDNKHLA